jgi:hypothetical protein
MDHAAEHLRAVNAVSARQGALAELRDVPKFWGAEIETP